MTQAVRLGIFIIVALLILGGAVFLIGDKQFLFHHTYRLNAQFDTAAGLDAGAEVRVGGIHEGTVKQIQLPQRPDGKITVVMQMERPTRAVLKKDSVAAIHAEGLVGDKYVEISFGSNQSPQVNDGDTIGSEPPIEFSDLMKKAAQILNSTQGAVGNFNQTAANLDAISSKINNGQGSVGALINDKSLYQRVDAGAQAFQENMEALKHNFLVRGFFRNRGYEDSSELAQHTIAQLPAAPYEKRFDVDAGRVFAKADTAKIKDQKPLKAAGEFLQSSPYGLAVVAVYGSEKGETDKLHELTQARAAVVRDALAQNFKIDDTRLKIIGMGKTEDASNAGKVEILVYAEGRAKK